MLYRYIKESYFIGITILFEGGMIGGAIYSHLWVISYPEWCNLNKDPHVWLNQTCDVLVEEERGVYVHGMTLMSMAVVPIMINYIPKWLVICCCPMVNDMRHRYTRRKYPEEILSAKVIELNREVVVLEDELENHQNENITMKIEFKHRLLNITDQLRITKTALAKSVPSVDRFLRALGLGQYVTSMQENGLTVKKLIEIRGDVRRYDNAVYPILMKPGHQRKMQRGLYNVARVMGFNFYFLERDEVIARKKKELEMEKQAKNGPWKLHLSIKSACGLRAADWALGGGGKSDPYVQIFLNEQKIGKTCVLKKTLDPVWNDTICVTIENIQVLGAASWETSMLAFRVYDYDMIGDDDLLGEVVLRSYQLLELVDLLVVVEEGNEDGGGGGGGGSSEDEEEDDDDENHGAGPRRKMKPKQMRHMKRLQMDEDHVVSEEELVYNEYVLKDSESGPIPKSSQQATGTITIAADLVRVMREGEEWEGEEWEVETEVVEEVVEGEDIRVEKEEGDGASAGAGAGAGGDNSAYWAESGYYDTNGEYVEEGGEFTEAQEYVAVEEEKFEKEKLVVAGEEGVPEVEEDTMKDTTMDEGHKDEDNADETKEEEVEKVHAKDSLQGAAPKLAHAGMLDKLLKSNNTQQNNQPIDLLPEKVVNQEQKQVVAIYVNSMFCVAVDKLSKVVPEEEADVSMKSRSRNNNNNNNNQEESDSDSDDDAAPLPDL